MSKTINQYWQAGVESAKLIIGGQIEVKTKLAILYSRER